jgi:hypothetical protein
MNEAPMNSELETANANPTVASPVGGSATLASPAAAAAAAIGGSRSRSAGELLLPRRLC